MAIDTCDWEKNLIFELMESGNDLFDAVRECDINKLELIINTKTTHGCLNINQTDKTGRTALFMSVCRGYLEITRLLIDNGADVKKKDLNGNTPLHWCGHLDILELLVIHGADVSARNKIGLTSLEMAKRRGISTDVISMFQQFEKSSYHPRNEQQQQTSEQYHSLFQEFSAEMGMKNMLFLLLLICFMSLYFAYVITGSSRHIDIPETITFEKKIGV